MIMLKEDTDSGHNMNLEYANLYLNILEDIDMAKEYANKEYRKRPSNIDVNKVMTEIAIKQENRLEAKKYFEVASSTNSKHPDLRKMQIVI